MPNVSKIIGVDFSANSKNSGTKTWVTHAKYETNGIAIEAIEPAREWLDTDSDRESIIRSFRNQLIEAEQETIFGFDFPFSLPSTILHEDDWEVFLERAPSLFADAGDFQSTCHRWSLLETGQKELPRECEAETDGMCAYNLRMYRMTYYGIMDLLRPLTLGGRIAVPPFHEPCEHSSRPIVVETYPKAVLDELEIEKREYKGNKDSQAGRQELVNELLTESDLNEVGSFDSKLIEEGDHAIDSLLSAFGVYNGFLCDSQSKQGPNIEGQIYA